MSPRAPSHGQGEMLPFVLRTNSEYASLNTSVSQAVSASERFRPLTESFNRRSPNIEWCSVLDSADQLELLQTFFVRHLGLLFFLSRYSLRYLLPFMDARARRCSRTLGMWMFLVRLLECGTCCIIPSNDRSTTIVPKDCVNTPP